MAIWLPAPDPASQVESRRAPYLNGIIGNDTPMRISVTLHRNLMRASSDVQAVFDILAMRMSHVFWGWKGTRCDFRFADGGVTPVFVLTPHIKSIRVEIRRDQTGYRDRNNLFPTAPAASSQYPGTWIRVYVADLTVAIAIADDVERALL